MQRNIEKWVHLGDGPLGGSLCYSAYFGVRLNVGAHLKFFIIKTNVPVREGKGTVNACRELLPPRLAVPLQWDAADL